MAGDPQEHHHLCLWTELKVKTSKEEDMLEVPRQTIEHSHGQAPRAAIGNDAVALVFTDGSCSSVRNIGHEMGYIYLSHGG